MQMSTKFAFVLGYPIPGALWELSSRYSGLDARSSCSERLTNIFRGTMQRNHLYPWLVPPLVLV